MSEDACNGKRKRSADTTDTDEMDFASAGSTGSTNSDKWSEELHRYFVAAIYDAGVSQSSPSVILENMSDRPPSLTSERVKSHLQKYRKNRQKSKDDFMQAYDSFMRKAMTVGGAGANASHVIMPPSAMIEMMGGGKPSGGDIAAFLSYSVMTEGEVQNATGKTISSIGIAKESQDYLKIFAGTHVPFPQLTEEEKRSPLGISMVYVMGLFSSLSQHMLQERRKRVRPLSAPDSANTPAMNINAGGNSNSAADGINAPVVPGAGQDQHDLTDRAPWMSSITAKQPSFLPQHVNQHAAVSSIVAGGNRSEIPRIHTGNSGGLFYPILSKTELEDADRRDPNAGWNAALQQSSGVPVFEARAVHNAHHGHPSGLVLPSPRNNGDAQGPDSYAQV